MRKAGERMDEMNAHIKGRTVIVNGRIEAKRGVFKAFRDYLNEMHDGAEHYVNGRYHQETRKYGDYLFHQDREQFDVHLEEALSGRACADFDRAKWLVPKLGEDVPKLGIAERLGSGANGDD